MIEYKNSSINNLSFPIRFLIKKNKYAIEEQIHLNSIIKVKSYRLLSWYFKTNKNFDKISQFKR